MSYWLRSGIAGIDWPAVPGNAGAAMLAMLFQLERSQWLDPQQLSDLQHIQLQALLRHAAAEVPLYRERIPASLLRGEPAAEDYAKLPLLTRADLQQNYERLTARQLPAGHGGASSATTSGSTGEPVRFLGTLMTAFFWQAFMLREHLWHRRDFAAKMLVMRVEKEPMRLDNWFGDVGAQVFRTGPCVVLPAKWTFERQLDRILEEKPDYMLGYASNVMGVLREADRRGVALPWLREARSFGEAVSQDMRDYVRGRWEVPFSDTYSARETGYLALQCPDHDVYHVQSESALLEVIGDDGRPCRTGEVGRVVITPLHNFGMPLIRYDIGDYAEVAPPCACGRGLPALRRIQGRIRNTLRMPDGARRWPTLGTQSLLDIAPIRRFKVVQKTLQDVEIRLIVERPLSSAEVDNLRAHFTAQFGHPFNWRFVFLDEFPPQAGDKFEDFVSEVA